MSLPCNPRGGGAAAPRPRRAALAGIAARRFAAPLLLATVVGACSHETPVNAPARPLARVRVATMPFLSSAPLAIAKQRGFFRDEGIAVEIVNLNANDGIAALASGHADVYANFLSVGVLNAVNRGARIAIVADKGSPDASSCVSGGLAARMGLDRERDLESADGLRGLKFGVRPMTTAEYVVDRLLEKRGIPREAVSIIDIPTEAASVSFEKRVIDARISSEPDTTRYQDLGLARMWLPFSEIVPDGQWGVLAFGPRLFEKDRALGVRFLRAYLRGIRAYREGKTAANVEEVAAFTGDDAALIARVCWPSIRADGRVSVAGIADFAAWARERGYVEGGVDAAGLVDTKMLDEAGAAATAR